MTQEEKAKAYDEALERAKDGLTDKRFCETEDTIRSVVEYIFPQLTESDDERIREEMIQYFTEMKKGGSAALPYDDCIAYLERQKEQKPANEQDYSGLNDLERAILRGFLAADVENVPVGIIKETAQDCLVQTGLIKWELPKDFEEAVYKVVNFVSPFSSEEELREISHRFAIQLLSLAKEEAQKSTWSEDDENMLYDIRENYKLCIYLCESQIEWIESLKYRIQLQSKQEWSEEDEEMIDLAVEAVEDFYNGGIRSKIINLLRSLRPQPKAELTLLDKNIIEAAVAFVEQNNHFSCWGGIDKHTVIKALRSLKPSWKPSEHQMNILKAVKDYVGKGSGYWGEGLGSLIDDLEKLM